MDQLALMGLVLMGQGPLAVSNLFVSSVVL